jgi:hypothetical protein
MSKSQFIKLSGLTFMAGSVAFMTFVNGSDSIAFPGSVISALLIASGMLSLRAGYKDSLSPFGKNVLLIGVIGMVLWYLGTASLTVMNSSGILHLTQADGEHFWVVTFGGPAVVLLALTLFGLTALRSKPIPRLNWLPILAGVWYPVIYFFFFIDILSHNGVILDLYWTSNLRFVIGFTFVVQFLALCMLGLILALDSPKELATA